MMGINVNSKGKPYADLIIDGLKTLESRNTDSLRPYVGRRVAIVRTGNGKAVAIGEVTIGEPIMVDEKRFRAFYSMHLVDEGSIFDIKNEGYKYLYPISNPERYKKPKPVGLGIIARKVID